MQKLKSGTSAKGKKILIIGPSGVGKTTFAGVRMPGPKLIFDFDEGAGTLEKWDDKFVGDAYVETFAEPLPKKRGRNTMISSNRTVVTAYPAFEDLMTQLIDNDYESPDGEKFQSLIFDSISSFEDRFLSYIMAVNSGQNRVMGSPNQMDYGIYVRRMPEVLSYMLGPASDGINVCVIAHIQTDKDELTGEIVRTPAIIGKKLPSSLGKDFDEVYFAHAKPTRKGVEYTLQFRPDRKYEAKTRYLSVADESVTELPHEEVASGLGW